MLVLMALMGAASAASSDVAGVYNKNLVGAAITIPAAETSDVDQIVNDASLNSTTKLLIRLLVSDLRTSSMIRMSPDASSQLLQTW
jgi:hypothetical protein